jgi:uridine kinase
MDHPATLDHELYARHLEALRHGEEVDAPVYDFKTHTRSERVERVSPKPFVIAEGILVLHYPDVRALCDYSIFLDVDDSKRLSRRIARDVRERGRTEASVLDQWNSNVQPMHERFCAPTREYASEILTETFDDAGIQALWLRIVR